MRKDVLILVLSLLTFVSCQTVVDNVDLPEMEIESVVHFKYDAALKSYDCSLTKSNPIFGKRRSDFEVINDALVLLHGPNVSDTVLFNSDEEKYLGSANVAFKEGETYKMDVFIKEGKHVHAKAIYPLAPKNISLEVDSTVKGFETIYNIKASWDDIQNVEEYYTVEYYQVYDFDGDKDTASSYVGSVAVGDNNSERISEKFTSYTYTEPGSSFSVETFVVISGITKAHYDYLQFLERYEPENPFTEPTTIPSNINGGLGMFVLKNSVVVKF